MSTATTCGFPLHDKFVAKNIPCDCQLPTVNVEAFQTEIDSTSHITDSQWAEFASEEREIGRSEARGA